MLRLRILGTIFSLLYFIIGVGKLYAEPHTGVLRIADNESGGVEFFLEESQFSLVSFDVPDELRDVVGGYVNNAVSIELERDKHRLPVLSVIHAMSGKSARALFESSGVRNLKGVILLVDFSNQVLGITPSQLSENLSTNGATVSKFIESESFGGASYSYEIYGPIQIPLASSSICDKERILDATVSAANAAGIPLASFNHLGILFPQLAECNFAGIAILGGNVMWLNGANGATARTVVHELGHTLGMSHSSVDYDHDGSITGKEEEYGDFNSVMGSGSADFGIGYTLGHAIRQDWLSRFRPEQTF